MALLQHSNIAERLKNSSIKLKGPIYCKRKQGAVDYSKYYYVADQDESNVYYVDIDDPEENKYFKPTETFVGMFRQVGFID